jgi:folate-binding protein YgfZ
MAEPTPLFEEAARAGAVFADEAGWQVPARFGDADQEYHQARTACALFDRCSRGKVEVSGPDSPRFLHNLSTNDVLALPVGAGCEAFLTTAKARVVAYLLLYHLGGPDGGPDFWLDLAPGVAPKVLQHLDHYLVSEQVELADHTTALAQVTVTGPQAAAVLGRILTDPLPPAHLSVRRAGSVAGECQVRRWDALGVPGYDVLLAAAGAAGLWQALVAFGARPAGRDAFERLRVEAGVPAQGPDIDENTFAPEAGRTATAICYTKGCYLGQEPVVMARDRGHLNRTVLRVELPEGPVPPGSALFAGALEVGRVTSSVATAGGAVGLAYVRRGHQAPGTALEVEAAGKRRPAVIAATGTAPGS